MPVRAVLALGAVLCALLPCASAALASRNQEAMFEEDDFALADPTGTLTVLRGLGVGTLRVAVHWSDVAPAVRPAGFRAGDPGSVGYGWAPYDALVQVARRFGIVIDLSVTGGAPQWATGHRQPRGGPYGEWRPDATQFGLFVQAITARYNGRYRPVGSLQPLPRVSTWEVWNEPNFGPDLAPQAIAGSTIPTSAPMYRKLLDAAWAALGRTGHRHDTIIIGNLDARGNSGRPGRGAPEGLPGNFAATKPVLFVRDLYCVDAALRPLRGKAAAVRGCPITAAGSRRFRAAHPALFAAAGFGDHPYLLGRGLPPPRADSADPNFALFNQLPRFIALLDRLQRVYGTAHRFALYNNEYGYITNPPNRNRRFASPSQAAAYINWAEYLSWLNPRIASSMQYLLVDPDPIHAPEYGGFASGLVFYSARGLAGPRKPGYDSYRLPIFLPLTTVKRGRALLIWGCARPARAYGNSRVVVQFRARGGGRFRSIATVRVGNPHGYFETSVRLKVSGAVRLAWAYPGEPGAARGAGQLSFSRQVSVSVTR